MFAEKTNFVYYEKDSIPFGSDAVSYQLQHFERN